MSKRPSGRIPPSDVEGIIRLNLATAYNYARWLTRNDSDAEDVVQEACARAWKYSDAVPIENGEAWFMTIVRNAAFSWIKKNRIPNSEPFEDEINYEDHLSRFEVKEVFGVEQLKAAIEMLDREFVEVLILKEIEGYSYQEIAKMINVPIGTVMSRLSRARYKLRIYLSTRKSSGGPS